MFVKNNKNMKWCSVNVQRNYILFNVKRSCVMSYRTGGGGGWPEQHPRHSIQTLSQLLIWLCLRLIVDSCSLVCLFYERARFSPYS